MIRIKWDNKFEAYTIEIEPSYVIVFMEFQESTENLLERVRESSKVINFLFIFIF